MTFDFFGERKEGSQFNEFVDFISQQEPTGWEFAGMEVELDPTVDFNNENIKIRWIDLDEGFNDKFILNDKKEFLNLFRKLE